MKFFFPAMVVLYLALIVDTYILYHAGENSFYYLKNVTILIILTTIIGCLQLRWLKLPTAFLIAMYCILISSLVSFPIRNANPDFLFEPYFIKIELIVMIITLAIGYFVHPIHIIIALIINLIFILLCIIGLHDAYPLSKFLFYEVLISGSGYVGYLMHMNFLRLEKKIKSANSMIRQRNTELKEINKAKDDLFSIIGHDLKTPFAQLIILIDLMDSTIDESEKQELKSLMRESAIKGNDLLQGLLTWSRTQSLKSFINLEHQLVYKIIEQVIQFTKNQHQSKQIKLINKVKPDLEIRMDERMMETIIRNLISNAIKFSKRNSEIKIESQTNENEVIISVIDQGIGMSEEQLRKLFKEERNHSSTGTENEPGSGFGLSICRKMAESQNGKLEIVSELNKGTTANIILPLN